MMRHLLILVATLACAAQVATAQVPEAMNYQAVARDGAGAILASQSLTVRIGIRSGSGAAVLEYEETHAVTTNGFGLFNLAIGEGTPTTGSFATIDWASDEHHIKIEVNDGSGFVDMGTSQLVSVPYAFSAKTLASPIALQDLSNATITSPSNGDVLSWNGSAWVNAPAGGGSGFNLPFGDTLSQPGSLFVVGNLDQSPNSSAILGVSGPGGGFTQNSASGVAGHGGASGAGLHGAGQYGVLAESGGLAALYAVSSGSAYAVSALAADGGHAVYGEIGAAGSGRAGYFVNNNAGSPEPALYAVSNGTGPSAEVDGRLHVTTRVGIGTPDPDQDLHILNPGAATVMRLSNANSGPGMGLELALNLDNADLINGLSGGLHFGTNGNLNMALTQDGNVVIGELVTDARLEVTGPGHQNIMVSSFDDQSSSIDFVTENTGLRDFRWINMGNATTPPEFRLEVSDDNFLSATEVRLRFTDMGLGNNTHTLHVDGSVMPELDNTYSLGSSGQRWSEVFAANGVINTSDARQKTSIAPLAYGLAEVMQLRPVSFDWIEAAPDAPSKIGLIAQEVAKILPEATVVGSDDNQTMGVFYSDIIPVLIKAIQEQQLRIQALEQELNGN